MKPTIGPVCAALAAALFLLIAPPAAHAQPGPPPPPGYGPSGPGPYGPPPMTHDGFFLRRGVMGGLSGGLGWMTADCDGCNDDALESVSGSFHVGWQIIPRLAIAVDGWALGHPEDGETLWHALGTVGAQYWVSPMFWIKGGLGSSQLSISDGYGSESSDTVLGVMAAGGFEVLRSPGFALDLGLRVGSGFHEDITVNNIALTIGVSFYQAARFVPPAAPYAY
jgi:hypothetical protein